MKSIAVEENFAIDCRVLQEAFVTAGAADLHPTNLNTETMHAAASKRLKEICLLFVYIIRFLCYHLRGEGRVAGVSKNNHCCACSLNISTSP